MVTRSPSAVPGARRSRLAGRAPLLAVLLGCALLTWSYWSPAGVAERTAFDAGLTGGGAPDLVSGIGHAAAHLLGAWKTVLAGLVVAAAVDALVPRGRLLRLLGHGGRPLRSAAAGALLGGLSMLCSGGAAAVAVALGRRGAPVAGTVAFWVAGPMLNPAVLVLCLSVLPWEWTAARVAAGAALVLFVAYHFGGAPRAQDGPPEPLRGPEFDDLLALRRFGRSLARLARTLLPDYLIVVLAAGIAQTWLAALDWDTAAAPMLVLAAVGGALLIVPLAAEIPVAAALHRAGAVPGVAGAFLVTLPVLSLPALLMLRAVVPPRGLVALAAAVVAIGAATGAALTLPGW
ncbi:hypothetical protein HDA32_002343 [Spinactinospora alkalitolerans]|uniref:Permease n=1 Tax=Spinactinospora alkalitolerans TaxID=687207 RepID=A0A852TWK5_9ACTN|nr:permease [Spinactinospora alkalitolerans]NYE47223.1 hypothetical protein [Spinactinospora alkalitolerans]